MQARLVGVVKDDALPGGPLTARWSTVSGPGTAIFADPAAASTVATFTAPGDYTLRLTATDGAATSSSTVTVTRGPDARGVQRVRCWARRPPRTPHRGRASRRSTTAIDPPSSNDTVNRRWGTWPQQGEQWVQLDWASPQRINASDMYFFDDGGGVRVPASWRIQYWDGESVPRPGRPQRVRARRPTSTTAPRSRSVTTTRMRAVLMGETASVGVLEWRLYAEPVTDVRPVHVPTLAGRVPTLPATATKLYADGARVEAPVTWQPVEPSAVQQPAPASRWSASWRARR